MNFGDLFAPALVGASMVAVSFASKKLFGHSLGINSTSLSGAVQATLLTTAVGGGMIFYDKKYGGSKI